MQLLTKTITDSLPAIGATKNELDPIAAVQFFDPTSTWSWYVIEFDGKDECFGLVQGFEGELGYFSLSDLEASVGRFGRFGRGIERDLYFSPWRISELTPGP